jgi:hypothetical protein
MNYDLVMAYSELKRLEWYSDKPKYKDYVDKRFKVIATDVLEAIKSSHDKK